MLHLNLCSGGIDSYLAWKCRLPAETINVYIELGHAYEAREIGALARLARRDPAFTFRRLPGARIGHLAEPGGIIPCRNAILLFTAAAHLGAISNEPHIALWLGILAGEINADKSPEFCVAVERVLNIAWAPQYWTTGVLFEVGSPVRDVTKAQLLCEYLAQGGSIETLAATRSCYDGGDRDDDRHCGQCASCFKRWIAFRAAGVADPTAYRSDPAAWEGAAVARAKARAGTYDPQRAAETLRALGDAR